jgi:hypothetical protein
MYLFLFAEIFFKVIMERSLRMDKRAQEKVIQCSVPIYLIPLSKVPLLSNSHSLPFSFYHLFEYRYHFCLIPISAIIDSNKIIQGLFLVLVLISLNISITMKRALNSQSNVLFSVSFISYSLLSVSLHYHHSRSDSIITHRSIHLLIHYFHLFIVFID